MFQHVTFKHLSGEMIILEVDPTESTEHYKKRLNDLDPTSFPAHRTSLVYDNGMYHILVSTELNVSVGIVIDDRWYVDIYYDCCDYDCWKCVEYYRETREYYKAKYNRTISAERPRHLEQKRRYVEESVTYMEKIQSDGFIVDEWRGQVVCDMRIPIATPTQYHLYVVMMDWTDRSCRIIYQCDTDSQEEYKTIMEEIWKTKRIKGREDYIFTNYLSRKTEDEERNDCILVFNAGGERQRQTKRQNQTQTIKKTKK